MIQVKTIDQENYEVTVTKASTTTHRVHLPTDYYRRLTGGKMSGETLLKRSFEFLLERESNTSILRRFTLADIETYFPEYAKVAKSWVKDRG